MEVKREKHSLKDVRPVDLEKHLICKSCVNATYEGRGEYFAGFYEYHALICKLMPNNQFGYKEELDGGENCSAPTEDFPDGYIELISECSDFKAVE